MKPAVILTIKIDGTPDCIFCGDVAEAHTRARAIKKGEPIPGVAEVMCLSARGVEHKVKFREPVLETIEAKRRGRPPKYPTLPE